MLDAEEYVQTLLQLLKEQFGERLVYVGLQGSYLRGEATENSDIDIMVVMDNLSVSDLTRYRNLLEMAGNQDKSCGFICSREDLANWNPLELWSLLHGTKDYYGTLSLLVPQYSRQDILNYAKVSLNNLYHEICHRYIHAGADSSATKLAGSYKSVFFILQMAEYLKTGEYISTKRELMPRLCGLDKVVMEKMLTPFHTEQFAADFERLFIWCQQTLKNLS